MLSPLCQILPLSQDTSVENTSFVPFQFSVFRMLSVEMKNSCGVIAPQEGRRFIYCNHISHQLLITCTSLYFFFFFLHATGCTIQLNRKKECPKISIGGSRSHDVRHLHFIYLVLFVVFRNESVHYFGVFGSEGRGVASIYPVMPGSTSSNSLRHIHGCIIGTGYWTSNMRPG